MEVYVEIKGLSLTAPFISPLLLTLSYCPSDLNHSYHCMLYFKSALISINHWFLLRQKLTLKTKFPFQVLQVSHHLYFIHRYDFRKELLHLNVDFVNSLVPLS